MEIRHAQPPDRDGLVAMALAFLASTPYGDLLPGYSQPTLEALVDVGLSYDHSEAALLVADDGGQLCGMLLLVKVRHPVMGRWYADEVVWWVDPAHRRARIGPALLQAAEYWTRSNALTMLKLIAPTGSRVGTFLERRGYRSVETTYLREWGPADGVEIAVQPRRRGGEAAVHQE